MLVGVIACSIANIKIESAPPQVQVKRDLRIPEIAKLFDKYKCSNEYDKDYITEADKDGLDWRLLPAISVQESTCGKRYPSDTNNLWGFGSSTGLWKFESVQEGISTITKTLASGSRYRNETTYQKLRKYGPKDNLDYPQEVINIMNQINTKGGDFGQSN